MRPYCQPVGFCCGRIRQPLLCRLAGLGAASKPFQFCLCPREVPPGKVPPPLHCIQLHLCCCYLVVKLLPLLLSACVSGCRDCSSISTERATQYVVVQWLQLQAVCVIDSEMRDHTHIVAAGD